MFFLTPVGLKICAQRIWIAIWGEIWKWNDLKAFANDTYYPLMLSQNLLFDHVPSLTVALTTFSPIFWTAGVNLFPGFWKGTDKHTAGANVNDHPLTLCAVVGGHSRGSKETMQKRFVCKATLLLLTWPFFSFQIGRPIIIAIHKQVCYLMMGSRPWDGHWEWCCRWQRAPPRLERQRQRWRSAVATWNHQKWGKFIQSWELSTVGKIHHLGFTVKLPAVGFIAAMYLGTVCCWGEHW